MKIKILIGLIIILIIPALGYTILHTGFLNSQPYFAVGNEKEKDELIQLSETMDEQSSNPEANFILIDRKSVV